jgi:hypothetical protein
VAVSLDILAQRQARHDRRMEQARQVVPHGDYCYTRGATMVGPNDMPRFKTIPCPLLQGPPRPARAGIWLLRLLKRGDYTQGLDSQGRPRATFALWDGLKECGLNGELPEEA